MKNKLYRVIDVNLNRAREGLRVIEDIARFYFEDKKITDTLKSYRHRIANTVKDSGLLLSCRNSNFDIGKEFYPFLEGKKKNLKGLVISNFRRVEESLRVLEDLSKIIMPQNAKIYKNLRFRVYTLEKILYERL